MSQLFQIGASATKCDPRHVGLPGSSQRGEHPQAAEQQDRLGGHDGEIPPAEHGSPRGAAGVALPAGGGEPQGEHARRGQAGGHPEEEHGGAAERVVRVHEDEDGAEHRADEQSGHALHDDH
jgi:hypothetical protein